MNRSLIFGTILLLSSFLIAMKEESSSRETITFGWIHVLVYDAACEPKLLIGYEFKENSPKEYASLVSLVQSKVKELRATSITLSYPTFFRAMKKVSEDISSTLKCAYPNLKIGSVSPSAYISYLPIIF